LKAGERSRGIDALQIDEAKSAHNCQRSAGHRIIKGQKRLKVRKERGWDHYCLGCGKSIVEGDLKKLADLLQELESVSAQIGGN
jgi:hypothetical protein